EVAAMTEWLSSFSDAVHKRVCRFLIHRYLSDFLKSKINLDQMSINLIGGTATVSEVDMDVQRLNEALDSAKVPLTVIEGYIGEVNASVPWQNLPQKSCEIEIRQLQITLQPQQSLIHDNQANLVTSMISSVVGSLASSMELAQSFMKEEQQSDIQDRGVEQFAEVIDAIVSRFRLVFIDTIIRLENEPVAVSGLCTAIELQIDWIEFIDEQLEACQTQGASMETITSQPHSLSAVPDLNKLFHLKGIRLYTDIFSKPEKERLEDDFLSTSQVVTSMYIRREKEKTKRKPSLATSSTCDDVQCTDGAVDSLAHSSISNYQSCYSRVDGMEQSRVPSILSPSLSPNNENASETPERLESNPILFAQFVDEKHTVLVRVRNNSISAQDSAFANKEIKLFFGGLNVFLTPSQLYILSCVLGKVILRSPPPEASVDNYGKPMKAEDYEQVETQLQARTSSCYQGTDFQLGNWGGTMAFFDAQRKPSASLDSCVGMANISLNTNDSCRSASSTESGKESKHTDTTIEAGGCSNTLLDQTHVRATLANFVFVLTHKDPLGQSNVRCRTLSGRETVMDIMKSLQILAERFFADANGLCLTTQLRLSSIRQFFDRLHADDHLRFLAAGITFDYVLKKCQDNDSLLMSFTAANCDLVEVLSPASTNANQMEHIELIHFPPVDENTDERPPHFRVAIDNRSKIQRYNVEVELAACESEIDISLLDRISAFLFTKPFFAYSLSSIGLSRFATGQSLDLKDDIFANAINEQVSPSQSSASIVLRCPKWKVTLRIPVADLRDTVSASARPPHWIRRVHDESLQLTFIDASLEMSEFDPSQITVHGSISLSAASLNGSFNGNIETLHCSNDDILFLHVGASKQSAKNRISMKLSYDFRNTSLKTANAHNSPDEMQKSVWGSYFKTNTKIEGPFSHKVTVHENEPVTMVGSREELCEFSESCLKLSNLTLEIFMPILRLHLPTHQFYELLYNRLVNDLVLWEPSSPLLKKSLAGQPAVNITAPFGDSAFQLCRPSARRGSESSETESRGSRSHNDSSTGASLVNESPHKICVKVCIEEGTLLIGALMTENKVSCGRSEIGAELSGGQLFVVNGYHGNEELTYFYFTTRKAYVFHKNITENIVPYEKDVREKNFARRSKEDVRAAPACESSTGELCQLVADDNFAVAFRIDFHFVENVKNVLLAVGIRNSILHVTPFRDAGHFWVNQLIDFFNVVDYIVPGYELPEMTTQLHIHLASSLLAYDHCCVKPNSPLKLRLVLGSCNVNSRIVLHAEVYKFECIFEDTKLFLSAQKQHPVNVQFGDVPHNVRNRDKFIEILSMGLFQLEVRAADNFDTRNTRKELRCPLIEIKCKNDLVKVWTCADSLVALINMAFELADSDLLKLAPADETEGTAASSGSRELSVKDSASYTGSLNAPTLEDQITRLQEMVQSAISSSPSRFGHFEPVVFGESALDEIASLDSLKKGLISDALNDSDDVPVSSHHRTISTGTDEGFCVVDEIPGSGITNVGGEPRIRVLNEQDHFVKVIDNHFEVPDVQNNDDILRLPDDYPVPLIKYFIRDVSLLLHLYGGSDFGIEEGPPKTYSCEEFRSGKGPGQRIDPEAQGGTSRDHSVHVEVMLSKISFVYELFGVDAPILSLNMFAVHEVEMRDKLAISQINKMLYQYASGQLPRRTCAPMFALRIVETHQNEGKMKISMLPLRLNCDQDTIEFLMDFTTQLSTNVLLPSSVIASRISDQVIMEVPAVVNDPLLLYPSLPLTPSPAQPPLTHCKSSSEAPLELGDLSQFLDIPNSEVNVAAVSDSGEQESLTKSALWMQNLFNENDLNLLGNTSEIAAAFDSSAAQSTSRFAYIPEHSSSNLISSTDDKQGNGLTRPTDALLDDCEDPPRHSVDDLLNDIVLNEGRDTPVGQLINHDGDEGEQETTDLHEEEVILTTVNSSATPPVPQLVRRETFFKEFSFSPSVTVRLDYQGKRVKTEQGALLGLLIGLSNLHCTQLELKELHNRNGMLGYARCVQFAINEWISDIRNSQLPGVIGSYGPISSLVQIGQGIRDLFLMPVDEYRKDDGHIVKGLQKGAGSFGISTASAAVDIAQRMVGLVQGVAELAFDIVTPDYPAYRNRRRLTAAPFRRPPNDLREGFHMAYETVKEGMSDTAQVLQLAAQEDRAEGHWPLRGLLRQATPAIIRPIVVASKATIHVLGGLKSQLKPDSHREEMDKWRQGPSSAYTQS
uniref:Autophagy-related protein 2 n=2 Tax=Parascaris univalens TaxID=6257 RepID=A0A915BPE2_PARUN